MPSSSLMDLAVSTVALDANVLDRNGTPADRLIDRLEALVAAGRLRVSALSGVTAETAHVATPSVVTAAYRAHGCVRPLAAPTHAQKLDRIRVRAILRGETGTTKHETDAAHVSEAAEAGCAFFVTNDKRILRRRDDLPAVLPHLRIVTPERLLALAERQENEDEDEDEDEGVGERRVPPRLGARQASCD